jgi:hypothetical protein
VEEENARGAMPTRSNSNAYNVPLVNLKHLKAADANFKEQCLPDKLGYSTVQQFVG